MTRRILSLVLALCIVCTQLPLTLSVSAETGEEEDILASAPDIIADTETMAEITEGGTLAIFRFVPAATERYTFFSSSDSDTYGMLADSEGYVLTSDDDSGEGNNFSITAVLNAGVTYYWAVAYYSSSATGVFPVMLQTAHAYVETVITPATCTTDGVMQLACEYCGEGTTQPIPAGHRWKDGVCTACGEVFLMTGACGDNLTWKLDGLGNLTISGTGEMWHYIPFDTDRINITESYYTGDTPPWKDYYKDIKTLTVEPGVTSIGYFAFWSLTVLKELTLPEGLTTIFDSAFNLCSGLVSVTLPSTLTDLDNCFEYCDELAQVRFEGPVPKSNGMVFYNAPAGLQIFYHGSHSGWEAVPDYWYLPEGVQWYDMDSGIAPDTFCFTQSDYTVPTGGSVSLTTNADSYVLTLLTNWTAEDPDILYISKSGLATGLRPGSTRVTVSSSDGVYSASCTVTVTGVDSPDTAVAQPEGTFASNEGANNYELWDAVRNSYLLQTDEGELERIQYISGTGVVVSRYNAALELISEQTIAPELSIFGGFFAGSEYNFLLYGQTNFEENNEKEVLRLVRYTKDWARLDSCSVYGANTTIPFDAGNADFAELNGVLYLHTCHEMYTASDGLNHQANMTYVIDLATMTVTDHWYHVMNISYGYVSHSFGQHIRVNNDYIFRVDHGDAHPRSIVLTRVRVGDPVTFASNLDLLNIHGQTGYNYTGVSVGGLELSSTACLVVGNSVDMSNADTYTPFGVRNIFLCVAEQSMARSRMIWLTEYTEETAVTACTPQIVKISDDLFLILWEEVEDSFRLSVSTRAVLVTGDGTVLSEVLLPDCQLSDCKPIVTADGLVTWFTADHSEMQLYQLSWRQLLSDPDSVANALGHEYTAVVTEPTCTTGGYTTHSCANCGYSFVDQHTEPLGHDLTEWATSYPPTCTSAGWETQECRRCGERSSREIPATGHDYTAVVTEPGCTSGGYTTYTCHCGNSYVDNHTEPVGHDFGEWYIVTAPTCQHRGEERHDCARCGLTEARSTDLGDHQYAAVVTEATCTEGGYTTYTCAYCGESHISDLTDPLGHEFGAWFTCTEPDCTTAGEEHRDCIRCDARETREIPATGHSHTNAVITEPTCTEQGYTTYTCHCGDSYMNDFVAALGHEWDGIRCARCGVMQHNPFTDVKESDFFYEPVLWAVVNGITSGTSATTFAPMNTCTRAQVVTFLWRAMGKPQPTSDENPFTDVAQGSYYYDAVLWAVENGITAGTGATTFSPDQSCTRAQVVTFLWRAMGKEQPENTVNPFADVEENAYYYIPVLWAVEHGITAGTSANTFSPNNSCTRAQVVTFLYRAME